MIFTLFPILIKAPTPIPRMVSLARPFLPVTTHQLLHYVGELSYTRDFTIYYL